MGNDYSIDYEKIKELITTISTQANDLAEKINKISTVSQQLESFWKGSDAEQYVAEMAKLKPSVEMLVVTYRTAMDALNKQMETMKDSQMMLAQEVTSQLTSV